MPGALVPGSGGGRFAGPAGERSRAVRPVRSVARGPVARSPVAASRAAGNLDRRRAGLPDEARDVVGPAEGVRREGPDPDVAGEAGQDVPHVGAHLSVVPRAY